MTAPRVFDRPLLRRRRRRAQALGAATFLIDRAAADLAERLAAVLRRFAVAVDLGSPTDAVRRALGGLVDTLIAVDATAEDVGVHRGPRVVADEEALPFAHAAYGSAPSRSAPAAPWRRSPTCAARSIA